MRRLCGWILAAVLLWPGAHAAAQQDDAGAAGQTEAWVRVESLLGTWVRPADNSELKIEAIDADNPGRKDGLRLRTKKHTYVGTYMPGVSPKPARVTFTRRPKPAEMNQEIPLWARQMVENKLEWVFELDEIDDCLCSGLKGRWYPGEVTWSEVAANHQARVSGKGQPVELEYQLKPPDPTEQIKAPVLFVLSSNTRIRHFEPLQSVAFKSPFRIQVLLPPEIAKQQGAELEVRLAAEKTWSSAKVTLKGSQLPSGVWGYTSDVTLVPVPTVGNTTWFRAEDGELVTATYTGPAGTGSASEAFSIYQNDVYQALAYNEETLNRLDETYQLLLDPKVRFNDRPVTPRERGFFEQKRQLIKNARKILSYNLPELVSLALGQLYIDMVQKEPSYDPDPRGDLSPVGPYHFDVDWVDVQEHKLVDQTVSDARERYTNIFTMFVRDFGVDAFRGLFLSVVDQVLIVFAGTDSLGQSYDAASRVLAGIQGVTQIALAGIIGNLSAQARYAKLPRAEAEREAWRARRAARERAMEAVRAESEVRIDYGVRLGAAASRGTVKKITFLQHPRTPRTPGIGPAFHEDLDGLPRSASFDPDPANLNPDPLYQCRGNSCALMSTVHAAKTKGAGVVTAERVLVRLAEHFNLLEPDKGLRSNRIPKLARLLGVDYEFKTQMSLAEVSLALERGEAIVGGMYYLDETGRQVRGSGHAIHITDILKSSATGQPTFVKYWDPFTGRKIGMLACDFQKIFDPRDVLKIK